VEQHFGEMAIQRLHRKGYYAHGSSRIMSFEEFANTLNYCLGFLNCEGTIEEYQNLFMEVDKDDDGYISYEDYFIFLKEYFGSKSIASTDRTPTKPKPTTSPPKYTDGSREGHQERFAKLIYTQLKVLVMDKDRNRNLVL
jgi:Ca2+-binding EF-hand superfamily protein